MSSTSETTTYVLLPGAGGDSWYWHLVAERLAAFGHEVAPMIPAPGESPGAWWSASGQTEAQREMDLREGRDPDAELDVLTTFFHDVPQDVIDEAFTRGEPRQSSTPFAEPWPLRAWPDVPTRVIAGARDRLFPLDFICRLAAQRLRLDVDVIDAGHLPALSRSDELAGLLEAYRIDRQALAAS